MALVPSPSEQQSIRACLVLIERCLSVVTDASTVACIKRFQTIVEELEEAGAEGLPEDDIKGLIEVTTRMDVDLHRRGTSDSPLNSSLRTVPRRPLRGQPPSMTKYLQMQMSFVPALRTQKK